MDTNEIINEEVTEVRTNQLETAGESCKGMKIAAGIGVVGIAVVCGFIVYKRAVKPVVAKIKNAAEQKKAESNTEEPKDGDASTGENEKTDG